MPRKKPGACLWVAQRFTAAKKPYLLDEREGQGFSRATQLLRKYVLRDDFDVANLAEGLHADFG
jgi:hypothetical protein